MADQLPADALRVINDFENAVERKTFLAAQDSAGASIAKRRQDALDAYTETKKALLNVFREIYGLEQLP
jgi:hypothetical protein